MTRWAQAAKVTGPVQSCGATGTPNASARLAILRASVRPPVHCTSAVITSTACCCSSGRKPRRPTTVSPMAIGTDVACLRRARPSTASGRIGSSTQNGSRGSSARQMRSAALRFQSPCSSIISCIDGTASRIARATASPRSRSSARMSVPPVFSAPMSKGHTFMPGMPSAWSALASSAGRCRKASRSSKAVVRSRPQLPDSCRELLPT